MEILILNWRDPKNPKSGGAEQVTLQHAKAWVKAGHTVQWMAYRFPYSQKADSINGITIIRKGNPYTIHFLAFLYYFSSGKSFDIIIDEIHGIPFFTPLYINKKKIIAFIHEIAGEIWDKMYPFPINLLGKFFERIYFLFYKDIIFWTDASSTVVELGLHGIKRKNCIAIPCPISNESLTALPQKEKVPTFIFVSRLVKMKGIEDVLKAFALITEKYKNAKLWIVGSGESDYVDYLKQQVILLGIKDNIVFVGKVGDKEKLALMSKSHILLHASIKEGWGLVIIEAASQGTPSVVYNVNGLKDTVKDEITGVVVKKNTPDVLAAKALALIEDKKRYQSYQKNGLTWASSLQWPEVTKISLDLLQKQYDLQKVS